MKKVAKMLGVLLMVFILSGCAKQHIHMDITNSDVTIEVTDAMHSSLRSTDEVAKLKEKYEALGYTVKEYDGEDDGMIGVIYTKSYKLSDVSSDEAVVFHLETIGTSNFKDPKIFKEEKGLFGNTYRATFVFNTLDASTDGFDEEELEDNADSIEIKYTVTLPNKAKSHNADSVDGKTYTWKIGYGENVEINYVFKTTSPLVYVLLIVGAIAIIGAVVFVILKKEKKNKEELVSTSQDIKVPMPQQPTNVENNSSTNLTDTNQNMQ